ncbi:DUF4255 domain-containing protein [Ancylothrix sp. C2]|uniref:DUF4255 domain-containing protein n=1 Tax=Ancylothrix sp. D3o TaxID=2953691 RepID=UPI0021BBABE0|nr:DUF4255 domain-containing protein [Ancylothrix sp. D3o]MCT7948245.1 DUF4255 domain-containing protein [Ancylothrix sp. D3o]
MLTAVSQTLAEILAGGASDLSTEQIDFNHPQHSSFGTRVNIYCYEFRQSEQEYQAIAEVGGSTQKQKSPFWFDISFLVTAWDFTALGEMRLLSEALILLLPHHWLPEDSLAVALRGYGKLPMKVSAVGYGETAVLWTALGVPMRPALRVIVTVPFLMETELVSNKHISLIPAS